MRPPSLAHLPKWQRGYVAAWIGLRGIIADTLVWWAVCIIDRRDPMAQYYVAAAKFITDMFYEELKHGERAETSAKHEAGEREKRKAKTS